MIEYDLIERQLAYPEAGKGNDIGSKIKARIEPVFESFYRPYVMEGVDPEVYFDDDFNSYLSFNRVSNDWVMKGREYKGKSLFSRKPYHYMVFDYVLAGVPREGFDPHYPRICALKSTVFVDLKPEPYTVLMLNSELFLRPSSIDIFGSNRLASFNAVTHAVFKSGDQEVQGCVSAGSDRLESSLVAPASDKIEGKMLYHIEDQMGPVTLKRGHYKTLLRKGISSVIKDENYALYVLGALYKSYLKDQGDMIIEDNLIYKMIQADRKKVKYLNDPRLGRQTPVPSFIGRAIEKSRGRF